MPGLTSMPRRYQVTERMLIARLEELEGADRWRGLDDTAAQRPNSARSSSMRASGKGRGAVGAPAAMQTPTASEGTGMATQTEKKLSELVRDRRGTPPLSP